METRIVNVRNGPKEYDLYIGRPRKQSGRAWAFGNPFVSRSIDPPGTAALMFRNWLLTGEDYGVADATSLRRLWIWTHLSEIEGKRLGCFCGDDSLTCHGNVLIEIFEASRRGFSMDEIVLEHHLEEWTER